MAVATFTTPLTFIGTTPLSAANLNTYLSDNDLFLVNPPMAGISSATTATTLTTATEATVAFDAGTTQLFDTDAMWTSPNDHLLCTKAGVYDITATCGFAVHATGERGLRIFVDSTAVASIGPVPGTATATFGSTIQVLTLTTTRLLALNEQVSMKAEQTSGGNLLCNANTDTGLSMTWVGLGT